MGRFQDRINELELENEALRRQLDSPRAADVVVSGRELAENIDAEEFRELRFRLQEARDQRDQYALQLGCQEKAYNELREQFVRNQADRQRDATGDGEAITLKCRCVRCEAEHGLIIESPIADVIRQVAREAARAAVDAFRKNAYPPVTFETPYRTPNLDFSRSRQSPWEQTLEKAQALERSAMFSDSARNLEELSFPNVIKACEEPGDLRITGPFCGRCNELTAICKCE